MRNISNILICCFLISVITCNIASSAESLPESDHPYANNFKYTWPEISEPGATQMRLHFTKMDLAYYDKLILLDKDGYELARYSYTSGENFWTPWYTEDTIKVRLETDGSSTAYGFKIDKVETRTNMAPPSDLPESYHDYANNFKYTWPEISKPGATQMRLHFARMDLGYADYLSILDKYGDKLTYYHYINEKDFWTPWYTEDSMKVRLETGESGTAYGFKIDKVETRTDMASPSDLPESYHDYANNFKYTWPEISKPGATQMRLHFTKIDLEYTDYLSILDKDGNELAYYHYINEKDYWTPWYTGDTLKVRLETDKSGTSYGFKVDKVETKPEKTNTPVADFSASPTSGNAPLKVQFTDKSTGTPTSWKWSFGDGKTSTAKNPAYTYSKDGNYTVSLTVKNVAGTNTKTIKNYITVKTAPIKPVAAFSASPTSGKAPLKVQFTDKSTGSPTSWKWSFGDGTYSTAKSPAHTYSKAGNYTVSLKATNAAGTNTKTIKNYITVKAAPIKPVAAFSAVPTSGKAPLKVQFTDKSTGSPTSWKWSFGDGTYSTAKSPAHTYSKSGKYTVSLTVKNAKGSNTKTMSGYIVVAK
jgi:PKD repeat protein